MSKLWDIFEEELAISVAKHPEEYLRHPGETIAEYAKRVRTKMQTSGIMHCTINSRTFRRVAKRLGVKCTYKALRPIEQEG